MNEREIQSVLTQHYYATGYKHMGYNVCPYDSTEMDFVIVSPRFLVSEIEVKISRSDFKRDATKKKWHTYFSGFFNSRHPNAFYYACPYGLIGAEELPSKAGLLWITHTGEVEVVKRAKEIHRAKCDYKFLEKLHRACVRWISRGNYDPSNEGGSNGSAETGEGVAR